MSSSPTIILGSEGALLSLDLQRGLANRPGVVVHSAASGWELLTAAVAPYPTLLLFDHWLPDMLGDEVLAVLREDPQLASTPVMVFGPNIGDEARERYSRLSPVRLFDPVPERDAVLTEVLGHLQLQVRREPRVQLALPAEVLRGAVRQRATTVDLSNGGALLEVEGAFLRGEEIELVLQGPAPLRTSARVCYFTARPEGNRIGVQFVEPSPELAGFLRARLGPGMHVSQVVSRIERLPSLPAVAARLTAESLREDADLSTLLPLVSAEPALSAHLLKLANAAAHRLESPVTSVAKAATLLGLNTVRNAALGLVVFQHLSSIAKGRAATALWEHSVATALACEMLAPRFDLTPAEAFTVGLLHDVGRYVLLDLPVEAGPELHEERSLAAEAARFGMDHGEIATVLLSRWKLPASLTSSIGAHHRHGGEPLPGPGARTVELLRAADALAHLCQLKTDDGLDDGKEALQRCVRPEELDGLRTRLYREFARVAASFGTVDGAELCSTVARHAQTRLALELSQEHQRAETLQSAYERARQQIATLAQREKHNALGRLSSGVAHEINNPLAVVAANLAALERDIRGVVAGVPEAAGPVREALDELPELLDEMKLGVRRIQAVVKALSSLGPSSRALELGDLGSCVDAALEQARPALPAGVRVNRVPAAGPVGPVAFDAATLMQAIVELLRNSYAAMPRGGELTVELGSANGQAWVRVRDTGVGIATADLPHLFEPFFTRRPVGQGFGLGLARALGIVSRHRGKIVVTSKQGEGTTAEVRLPLARLPAVSSAA